MARRVILFYPRTGWDTVGVTASLPLSVLYVAAPLVAAGVDVRILDERLLKETRPVLLEALGDGKDVAAFGVSAMTGLQITHGLEASRLVREKAPRVPIVWGGVHPTILGRQTLSHPLVDFVVVGEGEESFLEFVLRRVEGKPVEDIPGLGFKRSGGELVLNPQGPAVDLDSLPPLPYHLLDMPRYITTKILGERDMIIMASRGCPHRCAYCYQQNPNVNNRWRSYSPGKVVDLIQELRDGYDLNAINIQDDLFFGSRKWVTQVCEEILRRGIKMTFRADCRVDYINAFPDDFLDLVRKAGIQTLYVGVESGSDRVLEMIRKNITADDVRKAVKKLKAHDIIPQMSFMAGFPGETMEDVYKTLRLMLEVVEIYPEARTSNLQLYTPYPGTALWDEAVKRGLRAPTSLEEWGTTHWNRTQAMWFGPKERDFLELASYFSFFIDGKTVASWYGANPFLRFLNVLYTTLVRFRVRHSFYRFIIIGRVIRWLKAKGII